MTTSETDVPHQHEDFIHSLQEWTKGQLEKRRVFITGESSDVLYIMWTYLHPRATASSLDGRRLTTTYDGNLGVVPAQAQKGDCVVNVLGSEVALVVRPVDVTSEDKGRINGELRTGQGALHPHDKIGVQHPQYIDSVPMHGSVLNVEHYKVIGSCCFDGSAPGLSVSFQRMVRS
ncbi:hypothetical protein B0T21DRAFT_298633 [Apiosordaria backusii]|uniref:Uncharacterized protein n=1 Tax=Apiosordaria backusii TaxID=314023 RepID=A0AA40DMS9_9PEZI|nr:hypothetical protein B0T21DRAFT_298633 [Apiosordaria backusii]